MSAVNITNVAVLNNPAMMMQPFQFETRTSASRLWKMVSPDEHFYLDWKLIYVGSAEDEKHDQVLESVLVGPVNVGNYRFVFEADPPNPNLIPEDDILGVTVLLLTCSYKGEEFLRVGYYVNNYYADQQLQDDPPPKVLLDKIQRDILAAKPRITRFPIAFQVPPHVCTEPVSQALEIGEPISIC